jgi:hypothetical protein
VCLVRPKVGARSRRTIILPRSLIPSFKLTSAPKRLGVSSAGLARILPTSFSPIPKAALWTEGFTELFGRQTRAAGLGRIKFHSLRHLHCPTASGRSPGPYRFRTGRTRQAKHTLDLYSHVLSGDDATAAKRADEVLLRVLT